MNYESDIELSVVVPILNEEGNLQELYRRLKNVLENELHVTYEIIFVDDGSQDNSWSIVEGLHRQNTWVKGIKFSRNFGHQYALKAGLDNSGGMAVVSMDGDLQHPPELIGKLYTIWKEGYDVVTTVKRETKGISSSKQAAISMGYWLVNLIADIEIEKGAADFRLLDRKVVNEIAKMNEGQLFLRGIVNWIGYKATSIDYVADERFSGEVKYTLRNLTSLAVSGMMSFSAAPVRFSIYLGFVISIISFVYAIYIVIARLIRGAVIPGWTTTTFLILFLGGIIIIILGLIGEYIARIYEEVKQRPKYIIDKRVW